MRALIILAVVMLAGCATTATVPKTGRAMPPPPPLPTTGTTAWHIVRDTSQLRVRVYRTGVLGDLGHNHVLVTSDIDGVVYVGTDPDVAGFKLTVPVKSFKVDPVPARRQEGKDFTATVAADDRAGTRANMLGPKVLDAATYPVITLRSIGMHGPPWYRRITVRITLHGVSRDYVVPTAVVRGNGRITAIGGLTLRQSDFGITPFSVLAGALQVADEIHISFRFVAAR